MPMSSSSHHLFEVLPEGRRVQAVRRYAEHAPALHSCLHALYGRTPGFELWYGRLLSTVAELLAARSPALAALDAERAAQPGWFLGQQMLGYCAYVDRLGGDLRGVARRIPHLQELGMKFHKGILHDVLRQAEIAKQPPRIREQRRLEGLEDLLDRLPFGGGGARIFRGIHHHRVSGSIDED